MVKDDRDLREIIDSNDSGGESGSGLDLDNSGGGGGGGIRDRVADTVRSARGKLAERRSRKQAAKAKRKRRKRNDPLRNELKALDEETGASETIKSAASSIKEATSAASSQGGSRGKEAMSAIGAPTERDERRGFGPSSGIDRVAAPPDRGGGADVLASQDNAGGGGEVLVDDMGGGGGEVLTGDMGGGGGDVLVGGNGGGRDRGGDADDVLY